MPKISAPPDANTGRRRGRRVTSSLSEINVVPLVDVMLVLLIIFMVAAPMMQKGIEVKLPVSRRADKLTSVRPYISVPMSYRTDRRVWIDDEPIRAEVLAERMRQMMEMRTDKDVFLRGDAGVTLQELYEVIDHLKAGGVQNVGVTAQPRAAR
ncbi:MAG: protein TolR [Acidobacterium sp.]|nr:protein TolR [Acidobacteriota bacterium]PHY10882.1 MAG: protein TolR [Acidobacterium sp.]